MHLKFYDTLLYMIDSSVFQGKKAAYYTLGCKLNFSETSTFAKLLKEMGVVQAEKGEKADICLINTCSVTDVADHKCRQAIHRLVRENPGAFVVVTGCYAQLSTEAVSKIEGVSLVLGANEKANLIQYLSDAWGMEHQYHSVPTKQINTFQPSCSRGNRTRYFLKVQDGCNYFCTYCTIPYARGFSRNPSIASLVEQAKQAAAEGGKEIVLTGVNIGHFGVSTGESFVDLVKALDKVEGIERYRISSLEPDLLTDELIEYCATSRAFMPHFHIPLQSGSDEVLKLMHRRYDKALFAHKIRRSKQLLDMSEEKRIAFYQKYIGTTADVLFEKAAKGKAMHGFTDNYVRVELSAAKAREEYDNQIIKVKLLDFNHDKSALKCEIIG